MAEGEAFRTLSGDVGPCATFLSVALVAAVASTVSTVALVLAGLAPSPLWSTAFTLCAVVAFRRTRTAARLRASV